MNDVLVIIGLHGLMVAIVFLIFWHSIRDDIDKHELDMAKRRAGIEVRKARIEAENPWGGGKK